MAELRFQGPDGQSLSPKDILAYILVGSYRGDDFELDHDQIERTRKIMTDVAESRMIASVDIPPLSQSNDPMRRNAGNN